jgi:hypothetical protein
MVEAAGKLFWYRAPFGQLLRRCGVPAPLVNQLLASGDSKYVVMRAVLAELDGRGKSGAAVQQQLVRELVAMPIGQDVDEPSARDAQNALRATAEACELLGPTGSPRSGDERAAAVQRRNQAAREQRQAAARADKFSKLHREYCALLTDTGDRQGRGYRLEEMIGEVALLEGLSYTPPFRKGTVTQTDGMIVLDSFHYLIEARWRTDPPDAQALSALSHKVGRNLTSTRGLFVSVEGFRDEVVREIQTGPKNLLLMSGQEFAFVLEGRLALSDVVRRKAAEGAMKGSLFFNLAA